MELKNVPTKALVDELSKRDGVEMQTAEPHQDMHIKVNGPAIVLIVVD